MFFLKVMKNGFECFCKQTLCIIIAIITVFLIPWIILIFYMNQLIGPTYVNGGLSAGVTAFSYGVQATQSVLSYAVASNPVPVLRSANVTG